MSGQAINAIALAASQLLWQRKNVSVPIVLADGVERQLSFDITALQKIFDKSGENPMDAEFWVKETGKYETGEDGKVLYFDEKGDAIARGSNQIGKPRRIKKSALTPGKLHALIWAGMGDPALTYEDVGKLITLPLLASATQTVDNLFAAAFQEQPEDPLATSRPSAELS